MHKSFFGRVWQHSRKLFVFCLLAGCSWLLPAVLGFGVTPFYDWDMYAYPQIPRDTFEVIPVRLTNGDIYRPPSVLLDHRRMLITYSFPHYFDFLRKGDYGPYDSRIARLLQDVFPATPYNRMHNSPDDLRRYGAWLSAYTKQQTGFGAVTDTFGVYRVVYTHDYHLKPVEVVTHHYAR